MLATKSILRTTSRAIKHPKSANKSIKSRGYATLDEWKPHCPTWIDKNTKVICQGITGKQVRIGLMRAGNEDPKKAKFKVWFRHSTELLMAIYAF